MSRVAVLILHPPTPRDAGPLVRAFDAIRRRNAERLAGLFETAGADDVRIDDEPLGRGGLGGRLRAAVAGDAGFDGLIVLGSGSVPLAKEVDARTFVSTARGPAGRALANNRYSADVVAIAGAASLADVPDLTSDNGLPRWLGETAGLSVDDLRERWRLQVDLDSPVDALLTGRRLEPSVPTDRIRTVLARVAAASRDPRCELAVAGRTSAAGLRWLERRTASRTRALVEERGFRTRAPGQRPVASTVGLLLDIHGPEALGRTLARLGDAALVDSRVLLAHRNGPDERDWPSAEDRFASDLLLDDVVRDPWLRALTRSAREAPIPVALGGHTLVGPGLRLALGRRRAWA